MSLLGIDVGTTGCKVASFSEQGHMLALEYEEYEIYRPHPGWAELDANKVWQSVKGLIAKVAFNTDVSPIKVLSVSSLGEAVVPVTTDRQVIGPSILTFDARGKSYLQRLSDFIKDETLYQINGNTLGNNYTLTKLLWIKEHLPDLYEHSFKFLHWGGFVSFMLGAEPTIDFSLANRTLLFDLDQEDWSDELLNISGLDREKLPNIAPSGVVLGTVDKHIANELGLPPNVSIVTGAHDQCANAVGCGVVEEGHAVFGMGTFLCITPVFTNRPETSVMIRRGLNTEHHAAPGRYVSFIYNQGGSIVKWFRDTFAAEENRNAKQSGIDIYPDLFSKVPDTISSVIILPHFTATGPPAFISNTSGVIVGLRLETSRGDILKGILEGTTFYLKSCIDLLPPTGIRINDFRAVGGGSKSDIWIQICADIMAQPFVRPKVTEAGVLGAAIIAGAGIGVFSSIEEGANAMVRLERTFEPDYKKHAQYESRFEQYKRLWLSVEGYLQDFMSGSR